MFTVHDVLVRLLMKDAKNNRRLQRWNQNWGRFRGRDKMEAAAFDVWRSKLSEELPPLLCEGFLFLSNF